MTLSCVTCPYIKNELTRRLYRYQKTVSEHGIPNDIYGDLEIYEAVEELAQSCWCNKIGGVLGNRTCES